MNCHDNVTVRRRASFLYISGIPSGSVMEVVQGPLKNKIEQYLCLAELKYIQTLRPQSSVSRQTNEPIFRTLRIH